MPDMWQSQLCGTQWLRCTNSSEVYQYIDCSPSECMRLRRSYYHWQLFFRHCGDIKIWRPSTYSPRQWTRVWPSVRTWMVLALSVIEIQVSRTLASQTSWSDTPWGSTRNLCFCTDNNMLGSNTVFIPALLSSPTCDLDAWQYGFWWRWTIYRLGTLPSQSLLLTRDQRDSMGCIPILWLRSVCSSLNGVVTWYWQWNT